MTTDERAVSPGMARFLREGGGWEGVTDPEVAHYFDEGESLCGCFVDGGIHTLYSTPEPAGYSTCHECADAMLDEPVDAAKKEPDNAD